MEADAQQLKETVITANLPKMLVKDDTVVYNADAFRVPEGSVIESLVEALPGAKIDDDGKISINGKSVRKFKMDGRDFMTGNNDAVMKNLPSYVVDQVKAYDDNFERMPFELQAGVSKRLTHTPFRFSVTLADLNHWNYKFIKHLCIGADVLISQQIWVGMGYNFRRGNDMSIASTEDQEESSHGAGLTFGAGLSLQRFKINLAYGKYHVSSSSLLINAAYTL